MSWECGPQAISCPYPSIFVTPLCSIDLLFYVYRIIFVHIPDSKDGLLLHIPPNLQCKVVELLHHVKQIDEDLWKELTLCCHDNRLHIKALTYLLHTLTIW